VKCTCGFTRPTEEDKAIRKRVKDGHHEMINKKTKHWNCLVNPFKGNGDNKLANHNTLFQTCTMMTQVIMELGVGELFKVGDDYE
jgi:hypothetical protein